MSKTTTARELRDICMIYDGTWPISFWNFTDRKYEKLKYVGVRIEKPNKPSIVFSTDTDTPMNTDQLRKLIHQLPSEYENAEVVVKNHKNHHDMKITFSGSTNQPVEKQEVHFSINYIDPKYRKWKRDLRMMLYKIQWKCEDIIRAIKF